MNWRRWFVSAASAAALAGVLTSAAFAQEVTLTVGKLLELTGPLSENAPVAGQGDRHRGRLRQPGGEGGGRADQSHGDFRRRARRSAGSPFRGARAGRQRRDGVDRALDHAGGDRHRQRPHDPEEDHHVAGRHKHAAAHDQGRRNDLPQLPPDSLQARALAAAVEDKLGGASGKLLSIAYRNEPYGEGLSKDLSAAWQAKGGKIQGPVVFDPTQATFNSEAQQIVDNNPDAYVVIDYPDTFAKLGAALVRTGKFDASKLVVPDALAFSTVRASIPPQALEGRGGRAAGPTHRLRPTSFR